jgi:hypothetical protein
VDQAGVAFGVDGGDADGAEAGDVLFVQRFAGVAFTSSA